MKDHQVHHLLMLEIHCEIQILIILFMFIPNKMYSNHIQLM